MNCFIQENSIVVVKINGCSNCTKLMNILDESKVDYVTFNISEQCDDDFEQTMTELITHNPTRTFPMLFINNSYIGDYNYIQTMHHTGLFIKYIEEHLGMIIEEDF